MKVLLVDDEALARDRLRRMLDELNGYEVIGEATNGEEAVRQHCELQPDIILMDIRMPGMDGLQAARHIANSDTPPAVVFCTAYDEYAINAFDSQAEGYLLKPASREKLAKALSNASRVNQAQVTGLAAELRGVIPNSEQRTHVSARTHNGIELLEVECIRAFIADSKYVSAIYDKGEILIDDTLKELETEFSTCFLRIHRNALVATAYIERLERCSDGGSTIRLQGVSIKPQVSRRHLPGVRQVIKKL